ncbi:MAG: T9SS type A sorting domain-containing protein [Chlorobi bacterium]|nr:T9SS type A sorting domain-containing protein [Chlorobiota bacterium]
MKRVYFKGDTILHEFKPVSYWFYVEELLLYDFSKNVGDTIYFGNPPTNYVESVIENIDTIQIDNTLRKVYHFKNYSWVEWIEGIGNTRGLLFTSGDLPSNGIWGNLICFKQNDEILYFNNGFDECMPTISGIPINKTFQIYVFPNPSAKNINISFPTNETGTLAIYNIDGKKVFENKIYNSKEFEINLSNIAQGMYLLVFKNKDNKIFSNKLIIN